MLPFNEPASSPRNEVAAEEDVHDQRRQRGQKRAGHLDIPLDDERAGHVVQRPVIGWTFGRLVTMTPKRKSFHTDVNCQIITTTKPGIEIGKRM